MSGAALQMLEVPPVLLPTLESQEEDGNDHHPLLDDPPVQVVCSDDESDDAWAATLCRAERRTLQPTPSDESDNAWLVSLCRGSVNGDIGNLPPPTHTGASTPSSSQVQVEHTGASTPSSSQVTAERERSSRRVSSLDMLVSELIAAGCPPQTPRWSVPTQDALLVCGNTHSSWPPVQKCLWRFASWGKSLGVFAFKIGIAYSPQVRWGQYEDEEMWLFMDVMHDGNPEECRCLEKELISKLGKIPGCYNIAPGGEGIRAGTIEGKCSCYAVYATAGDGIGLHEAWLSRKRAYPR